MRHIAPGIIQGLYAVNKEKRKGYSGTEVPEY